MIAGKTVWYRLSKQDISSVAHSRLTISSTSANRSQYGRLEAGMLLPAEVVVPYSTADIAKMNGTIDTLAGSDWPKREFSGIADIRVSLRGIDFLWKPMCQEDKNAEEYSGVGSNVTILPKLGMFTQSGPAELVN